MVNRRVMEAIGSDSAAPVDSWGGEVGAGPPADRHGAGAEPERHSSMMSPASLFGR
jgi:hypothetical protein